jgi:glyoxylate reductase
LKRTEVFMKPKVFVTRRIPQAGLFLLEKSCAVEVAAQDEPISRPALLRGTRDADALLCMLTDQVDVELMEDCPHLKIIANYAVGLNNIDLLAAKERGIVVANTPDVLTDATADLAWGLILDVARGISAGDRAMRRGEFRGWAPLYRLGREVSGKTLGILGMGRIGQAVAARAAGFRMKVLYHQRHPAPGMANFVDFHTLLKESDFLSIHCPLTEATKHLIGEGELALMKPGSFLINTARGPVVDEAALVRALKSGQLGGAGLDVFEREPAMEPGMAELENVVIPPHLGSATVETRDAMATLAAQNILDVLGREK